ncbi:electron transfer flavoprotein subunit alpha [Sulfolobales archaeon HS-7]|nr:electron transfer flavoprotein subunit alpha [Sulfolobales archaeon HS-7]
MIVVYSTDQEKFKKLSGFAQTLSDEVIGVAPFRDNHVKKLIVAKTEDLAVETISEQRPSLVLLSEGKREVTVGARVAARLNAPFSSSCNSLKVEGGKVVVERLGFGGVVKATVELSTPAVVVIQPPDSESREFETEIHEYEGKGKMEILNTKRQTSTVNLQSAKVIVSVGRGIGGKENVKYAEELAQVLNAALAGSRPVTAELKWLPEDRQVGLSGTKVRPKVYIAVGISGQPQHLAGMKDSGLVIAVNKDKNAPIVENADYTVIADAIEFCKAITEALKK